MEDSKVQFFDVDAPKLNELVPILQQGLKSYFAEVSVELTDCPNFSQRPYKLAIEGLHGKPTISDVGGGKGLKCFD